MEGLAPTHILCIEIRHGLERGEAVISTLKNCITELNVELSKEVRALIAHYEHYGAQPMSFAGVKSIYRRSLFQLILSAMAGEPILKRIVELEKEMQWACEEDIEHFVAQLPTKVMLPILLIQFPAFLLLLLGPILSLYFKELAL